MQVGTNISIFLAEYLIWVCALVIPFLILKSEPHDIVRIVVAVVLTFTISEVLKTLTSVPRPFVVADVEPLISVPQREFYASFPSGHAAFTAALATGLFFTDKLAGLAFFVIAVLVGWGRVLVGVHYPLDIFGGFGVGITIAVAVNFLHRLFPVW